MSSIKLYNSLKMKVPLIIVLAIFFLPTTATANLIYDVTWEYENNSRFSFKVEFAGQPTGSVSASDALGFLTTEFIWEGTSFSPSSGGTFVWQGSPYFIGSINPTSFDLTVFEFHEGPALVFGTISGDVYQASSADHTGMRIYQEGNTAEIQNIAITQEVTVSPSSIPEPTTLTLLGLGLTGIGYRRKKAK